MDEIYFATCVKKAKAIMNCPMNLDPIKAKMEEVFKVPIKIGTGPGGATVARDLAKMI